jgi:hypothetical protein
MKLILCFAQETLIRSPEETVRNLGSAPTARNVIAQGNALGKGPSKLGSAESAKYGLVQQFRAFSARTLDGFHPGPLAQAIPFRAVGAQSRSFHVQLESLEKTFCGTLIL